MSLDKDTVRRIATLARIRVDEDALEPLAGELNNILGWVEQLNEVDTEGVPPMTSVVETEPFKRSDTVDDGDKAEQVLANAPEEAEQFFVVPKVVE
ncbi:MAG: Asp-tRNA(Asn)/Glu-tRNA(Gln) amidotransferase subunit GatC [Rhodospirillaceae bacterium]|nr:Asp-tRNA(Asn)/Glu-tRNA(Gln) amidotransferase subunit GatC [Rhodospirillaceae bacterium]MDD9925686.1 Asp-tRNA(Asn)/Glu-tRNA(Gln) amidotransferase subunit GatC [Rhodospirillaceae bacterium]